MYNAASAYMMLRIAVVTKTLKKDNPLNGT